MKQRTIALALGGLAALGVTGVLAAPTIVQYVAEQQVDKSLAQIRRLSTAVANRGAISVDISKRSVTIRDLSIDPPGDGSTVSIGALTIVRPWQADDHLTAKRIVARNVRMVSPLGETLIPRFEIRNYSGLSRGLVATPGIGTAARTQADVIAQISSSSAAAPSIEISETKTRLKRTFTDVTVGRIERGVVQTVAVGSVAVSAPDLRPGSAPDAERVAIAGKGLTAQGLSLPTLWRFYAGDGAGDRDPLVAALTLDALSIRSTLAAGGALQVSAKGASVRDFRLRALSFPFPLIEDTIVKLSGDDAPTPAETRQRIGMAVDAARAFSFESIGAHDIAFERRDVDGVETSGAAEEFELRGYADARMASVRTVNARYGAGGVEASAKSAEITGFDATRIADYGARVGRDEVMLLVRPTADEIVKTAPRIAGASIVDAQAKGADGSLAVARADIDLDAPLDNVPQKITARIAKIDAIALGDTSLARLLDAAALDKLEGGGKVTLTFDPNTKKLSLDEMKARFEGVGAVSATGAFAEVDPMLALSTGSELFGKISAVVIEPFKFTIQNDGGFETLLTRAAAKAGEPMDVFRTNLADRTEKEFGRLFGPPALQSAAALAGFIRDPRSIVVSIDPKDTTVRLLEFIQSFGLGPAGIAQTIDVRVLNVRS